MRTGSRLALSPVRRATIELLHHARQVPSLPTSRVINVAALAEAREQAAVRPSWLAIFLRAYGLTGQRHPELRRAFIPYPWPHLYEHPQTVAAVLVERDWEGEKVVLASKLRAPEEMSLQSIAGHLRRFREAPVLEVSAFRQIVRLGRLPWPLLRFTFWHTLYLSGHTRARRFGTCMVSSIGQHGSEQHHPLTPLTTYFTFGPISPLGDVRLTIIYDHRVTDDSPIARCLATIEEVLHTQILHELRALERAPDSTLVDTRGPSWR